MDYAARDLLLSLIADFMAAKITNDKFELLVEQIETYDEIVLEICKLLVKDFHNPLQTFCVSELSGGARQAMDNYFFIFAVALHTKKSLPNTNPLVYVRRIWSKNNYWPFENQQDFVDHLGMLGHIEGAQNEPTALLRAKVLQRR
jgi:hypothetical protein